MIILDGIKHFPKQYYTIPYLCGQVKNIVFSRLKESVTAVTKYTVSCGTNRTVQHPINNFKVQRKFQHVTALSSYLLSI